MANEIKDLKITKAQVEKTMEGLRGYAKGEKIELLCMYGNGIVLGGSELGLLRIFQSFNGRNCKFRFENEKHLLTFTINGFYIPLDLEVEGIKAT